MSLDATVGGATTNSYVTLTEASDYFVDRLFITKWDAFSDQEIALVTASRMLNWYMKWKGVKTDPITPQAMDWPRTDVYDGDGFEVPFDIIPEDVKIAVFELALTEINSSIDRNSDNDLAGLKEVRVGPLMVKSDGFELNSTKPKAVPSYIERILKGLVKSGDSGVRVTRLIRA